MLDNLLTPLWGILKKDNQHFDFFLILFPNLDTVLHDSTLEKFNNNGQNERHEITTMKFENNPNSFLEWRFRCRSRGGCWCFLLWSLSSEVLATLVNRTWAFFSFNMPWRYQIYIAKCLSLAKRRFEQELVKNHGRRVQKLHFRLTCVARKHFCLSSLHMNYVFQYRFFAVPPQPRWNKF